MNTVQKTISMPITQWTKNEVTKESKNNTELSSVYVTKCQVVSCHIHKTSSLVTCPWLFKAKCSKSFPKNITTFTNVEHI